MGRTLDRLAAATRELDEDRAWAISPQTRVRMGVVAELLAEVGVVPDESQTRTLLWLCGWEPSTVANLVDLIVDGRPKVVGSHP